MGKLTERVTSNQSVAFSNVDTITLASSVQSTTVGDGKEDTAWEGASSVNESLHELVAFDDEGHPYIDVNKLSYKPRKKQHDHQKEKLSWYLPDFSFIVFNIMSLGCSTYFILIGNTTLTWKASIGMFSVPNCYDIHGYYHTNGTRYESDNPIKVDDFFFAPCEIFLHEKPFWNEAYQEPGEGYNFSVPGSHPVLRTKLTDVHYLGLVLIVVSLINILNVCVGINACLQGYKTILYGHIATDGVIVLVEFIICAAVHFTGRCEEKDIEIIRVILQHFIQWYGFIQKGVEQESAKEKLLTAEVDSLQIGLSCCGADGWQDYLASSDKYPSSPLGHARSEIDETEAVIPFSCCRPWWVRNIYCAHGVHRWAHPLATAAKALQFHERINQDSCTFKLERMCYKIKSLMGVQGFVTSFVHLFFIVIEGVAAFVLVNNINDIIKEKKRAMKEREISHGPTDGGDGDFELMDEEDEEQEVTKSAGGFSKMPPPTEDQIVTIKQRSNYNEFITKVKTSHVGHWMRNAQKKVTAGHENDNEYLTAEEKKARAKELLHKGKGRNDEDDTDHHHRHPKHHPSQLEGLESMVEIGESPGKKRAKQKQVKLEKIKSKLDTGRVVKRKSRKTLAMGGGEEDPLKRKSTRKGNAAQVEEPRHIDDVIEDFHITKDVENMMSKFASKFPKRKQKKLPKVISTRSVIDTGRKALKSKSKRKPKAVETVESTSVIWKKGDNDTQTAGPSRPPVEDEEEQEREDEVEQEDAEDDKPKKKPKPAKSQRKKSTKSDTSKRSKSSTQSRRKGDWEKDNEGSEEDDDGDSEYRRKRKKSSKASSRKKKSSSARSRRSKNNKQPREFWLKYF